MTRNPRQRPNDLIRPNARGFTSLDLASETAYTQSMRWVVGPIPPSKILQAEQQGWTPLSEPNLLVFTLQAAFLSMPFCVMAYLAACQLKPYVKCHPYLPVALLAFMLCLVFCSRTPARARLSASLTSSRHCLLAPKPVPSFPDLRRTPPVKSNPLDALISVHHSRCNTHNRNDPIPFTVA